MLHPEIILLVLYVFVGPLIWAGYGEALLAGRRKMLLMKRPPHPIKGEPPSVTILIPAKDEGERIRRCIESALDQEYPHVDVIAIDDRSTDNTGAVMDEIAAIHPKLHVIHIKQPPAPGWTGKNNALFTGAGQARGQWLLFIDSDVTLERDAVAVAMSVLLRKEFDMISLLPRLETHGLWEKVLIPLAGGAASTMYAIALNNKGHMNKSAFANGQFLLISRSAYDAIGGHETVRDRYCEDVEIARQMKLRGLRPRVSWGNDFCSVRMYNGLGAIIRGWSRIYYAAQVGSPWRVLAALAFIFVCCFSAYAALGFGIYRTIHPTPVFYGLLGECWIAWSLIHLTLMTVFLGAMYRWSGNRRRNALLFPLGGAMMVWIFLRALKMCVTKKVEWRGTAYSHTMAQDLSAAQSRTPV